MKIRKNDTVKMLSGKDRGKTGKVLYSFPGSIKIVVEGLNKVKRHMRAKKQGQKGQIIEKERAVNVSATQIMCPKCGKPARLGYKFEGKSKVRFCKKCEAAI